MPSCRFLLAVHPFFQQREQTVDGKCQDGDQQRAGHRHRRIVGGDAAIDRHAQTAGADEGSDAGQGDGHRRHGADAGEDDRHCQRQLDAHQCLEPCTAHALGCLQQQRIDVRDAGMGVAHHRQQCIDRQRDDGRQIADTGERDEKAQHGNGGDRIEKTDNGQCGLGAGTAFADEDADQTTQQDGDDDGCQGDLNVFDQQSKKEITS